ncbi:interleukin-15 receptor subunit alpha isoform X2 [Electrophorus electricus]|uniref:interleukin-15 receptor subunit alpha isoform X2 n=1 Tax=Electrophorus electricus TaxID=8005 RepID=UPI0015CFB0EC|nr:interleukin-15 receptor subunit alpha isoform X2 [Electrophorus electricus]
MRPIILTLFFITTEYSLIIRGKCETCNAPVQVANTEPVGNSSYTLQSTFRMMCIKDYVRKAGTSNLFRCTTDEHTKNCSWKNYPALECILTHTPPHTSAPPLTASSSTPRVKMFHMATETRTRKSTSMTSGQIGFTTHTVATATGTPLYSTVRTIAEKEETMTTANWTVLSSSSTLTGRKYLTTESSESKHKHISSTTADLGTSGIAAGLVLVLIAGLAATVMLLLWCRGRQRASTQQIEMTPQSLESGYSLLVPPSGTNRCLLDSSQEKPACSDTMCT